MLRVFFVGRLFPFLPLGDMRLGIFTTGVFERRTLGLAGIGGARLVLFLADEFKIDRTSVELKRLHQTGFEVTAILLGDAKLKGSVRVLLV